MYKFTNFCTAIQHIYEYIQLMKFAALKFTDEYNPYIYIILFLWRSAVLKIKSCFIVMARRRWIRVYICCRPWLRRWWWYVFQNHLFLIRPAVVHFRFPLMLKIIFSVDFRILLCIIQNLPNANSNYHHCVARWQRWRLRSRNIIYASDIALNIGI